MIGFRRLAVTTRAMDEVGARVTRYLLTQSAVNAAFATLVAAGLAIIGVPYAVLFGVRHQRSPFLPGSSPRSTC